jgi:hypothetical protein
MAQGGERGRENIRKLNLRPSHLGCRNLRWRCGETGTTDERVRAGFRQPSLFSPVQQTSVTHRFRFEPWGSLRLPCFRGVATPGIAAQTSFSRNDVQPLDLFPGSWYSLAGICKLRRPADFQRTILPLPLLVDCLSHTARRKPLPTFTLPLETSISKCTKLAFRRYL